jgi:hypothetical protein
VHCEGQGDALFRFCQQCGKLELLSRFEANKRSCRSSLSKRRIASSGSDEVLHPPTMGSSSGSSSMRVSRSRAIKRSRPSEGLKQSCATGIAVKKTSQGSGDETPACQRLGQLEAMQPAAAAAAPDGDACAADVAAALAEALSASILQEFDRGCHVDSAAAACSKWQHDTQVAQQQQQQAQSMDIEFSEFLQSELLFADMCTALEDYDGSCCSCSSTHEISSEQELEQLLNFELRAAAAAAICSPPAAAAAGAWPSAFAQPLRQAVCNACPDGVCKRDSINKAVTSSWQQQQQQLAMQQQQQQQRVTGMFVESRRGPVTTVPDASALQQQLTHLQEVQQHLEQLQYVLDSVHLRRQQAAALLMAADAAAAAAVAAPALQGIPAQGLQRSLTLQSSSNACYGASSWGAFV